MVQTNGGLQLLFRFILTEGLIWLDWLERTHGRGRQKQEMEAPPMDERSRAVIDPEDVDSFWLGHLLPLSREFACLASCSLRSRLRSARSSYSESEDRHKMI